MSGEKECHIEIVDPHAFAKWTVDQFMKSFGNQQTVVADLVAERFGGYENLHRELIPHFNSVMEGPGRAYISILSFENTTRYPDNSIRTFDFDETQDPISTPVDEIILQGCNEDKNAVKTFHKMLTNYMVGKQVVVAFYWQDEKESRVGFYLFEKLQ
jgi:hypothetical protein